MKDSPTRNDRLVALRIVVTYALVAAIWIFLSDTTVGLLLGDSVVITRIAVAKGFLFILVTGVLLYHLLLRHLHKAGKISNELRRHQDLLQAISDGTPDVIFAKDRQGRYLLFNKAAERVTGKSSAEVLGHDDNALFSVEEVAKIRESDQQVQASGQLVTYEEELQTAAGETRIFHTIKGPIFAATGEVDGYFGIARDISERKRAEKTLRVSKQEAREKAEQLQAILDAAPVHILIARGRDCGEIIGNSFAYELLQVATGTNLSKSVAEPPVNFHLCRDGQEMVPRELPMQQVAASGQPLREVSLEYVFDDGRVCALLGNVTPLFDAQGQPDGAVGAFMDVTELKKKAAQLQEKNAEVERFAYMVSHDLKSPLVTIKAFLGYLEQDLASADSGRIATDILHISKAADMMAALIDDLLKMSRLGRPISPPERLAFDELINEALQAVAGGIAMREVSVTVTDQAVTLVGDRSRLTQLWQNLIENAVKFMGGQPAPQVEIGMEKQGRETVFFVRDNGIGIEAGMQNRIFGVFEKLDPVSEGSGLGLATAKRLVELYQGRIWVESAGSGSGACFRFTLPGAIETAEK